MGRIIKAAELATRRSPGEGRPKPSDGFIDEVALKQAVVSLAVEMARRIVGRTVEQHPAVLDELYARGFDAAGMFENAVLRIHPDDRRQLAEDSIVYQRKCKIVEDPAVGRGGYRLSADFGEIDGAIDTLLDLFGTLTKASS